MIVADKRYTIEANARKKYAAKDRRSFRRPERRQEGFLRDRYKVNQILQERKPLTKDEENVLIDRLKKEPDVDKAQELLRKAQEHNLKISNEVLDKVEKRRKAREDMKQRLEEMKKRSLSATEKDAIQQIQSGHADRAMRELKTIGQDGALGNEIAENSLHMAKDAKILAEGSPTKDSNSMMKKMLAENSVPADTLYERKRDDKSDQNREGVKHKDTTEQQMSLAYMKRLRGAAYGG